MKEITIDKNESNQRIDRFLKKYFSNANMSFIYKMLRKKRIKLNNKKANPEEIINDGDKIQLYISDETMEKFIKDKKEITGDGDLNIVYEDENIVIINKPKGVLSHATDGNYKEKNVVDQLVAYLYNKGEYVPRLEKTFTPSICNRLDRNTSGIIIGAKNYNALQSINKAIKDGNIKKYYKCIVSGKVEGSKSLRGYLVKDENNNKVSIDKSNKTNNSKEISTDIKVLKNSIDYSLLEIDLITGRTHQIRAHLSSINHPIIGDLKYGNFKVNKLFKDMYKLDNQYLHAYRVIFDGFKDELKYLNNKEFICNLDEKLLTIEKKLFN